MKGVPYVKRKLSFYLLSLLIPLLLLTGCSVSEEDVQQRAKESFETKMEQEETKPATFEDENIQMYVPSFAKVERLDEYNLLLERDEQIFLLFVHDKYLVSNEEDLLKQLMIDEEPFILEMKTDNEELGYLVVVQSEDEEYIIIVGYDKYKITTMGSLDDVNDLVDVMLEIVRSAITK